MEKKNKWVYPFGWLRIWRTIAEISNLNTFYLRNKKIPGVRDFSEIKFGKQNT